MGDGPTGDLRPPGIPPRWEKMGGLSDPENVGYIMGPMEPTELHFAFWGPAR